MPSESATGWRWVDRCAWRGFESPPRLVLWPRPSWGAALFAISLLLLFAQWWWLGRILGELPSGAGEELHRIVWIYRCYACQAWFMEPATHVGGGSAPRYFCSYPWLWRGRAPGKVAASVCRWQRGITTFSTRRSGIPPAL